MRIKDLFNFNNSYKFVTKEGAEHYHIHRYLGIFVLINYLYRIILQFSTGIPFDNEGSYEILFVIFLHSLLSFSSLLFHIPEKRNKSNPMIWPEFRWHSIYFACRSFVAMFWTWFCININIELFSLTAKLGRIAIVFANLYITDQVTSYYKKTEIVDKNDSTMRKMPFPSDWSEELKNSITWFYTMLQFCATLAVMLNPNQYTLLLSAIPVQLAALLMTCVRKSIISSKGWHFWYSFSFILAFTSVPTLLDLLSTLLGGTLLYGLRRYYRINKYIIWTGTAIVLPQIVQIKTY